MSLGSNIKRLRDREGIQQKDFAKKIGISNVVLSRYESDERKPDYDTLQKIADYFEVSIDFLLGREDNPHRSDQDEFEALMNNPEENQFFKEFKDSPEERRKALLAAWDYLKSLEKK